MILLCDTNIFLQTNISSHLTLMQFFRETRKFFIGLDKAQAIEQEYLLYGRRSPYLQNVIQRLQRERADRTVDGLSGELDPADKQRLATFINQYDSISNVELSMLTIALANPDVILVCVDTQCHSLPINRQLMMPDQISILQEAFPEIKIKHCDDVVNDLYAIPEGIPRDISSLEIYLDSKSRREHDFLEFKQPKNGLISRMCRDIAKAVCAMLNSTNGFVMIGVDEDANAQAKGFEKSFNNKPKRSDELEIRLANDYLLKIEPRPDCFIKLWTIDKNPTKIVMIIFIEKGSSQYRYRFDQRGLLVFRRIGTQSRSNL